MAGAEVMSSPEAPPPLNGRDRDASPSAEGISTFSPFAEADFMQQIAMKPNQPHLYFLLNEHMLEEPQVLA